MVKCHLWWLVLVVFLIPCTCKDNSICINQIESFLKGSEVNVGIDVVVPLPSNITWALGANKLSQNFNSFSNVLWSTRIVEENDGPILVLFPCLNKTEFVVELANVVDYLRNNALNLKGRLWTPIFIFPHPLSFNYINQTESDSLIASYISKIQISTGIYIQYKVTSSPSHILIREIYSIRGTQSNQVVELNPKLNALDQLIFRTRRRSNFRKAPVIAIGIDDPDYPLATEFKPNTTELIGGFEVEIYQYFRDALNFTEIAIKGSGYVREGKNNTLTGYSTELNSGLGDIAIGSGEFLEYRMKAYNGITYVHPIFHANVIAYFKQPPASSIRNIFTQTFTMELWICSLAVWGLIIFTLRMSVKLVGRNGSGQVNSRDIRISDESVIWAAGAICQQGWHTSPYSTPVKIVFFCGIFTGLISYVAYSAALVSILAVEVVPIRAFQDLITEKFYIASDSHIPTAKVVVKDLEDSGQIKKLAPGTRNVEITENWDKLFKTRFAIVTIPDSFYPVIQQNYTNDFICSTVATKIVSPRPLKSSCFLKRGSHLREFFNYKLLQMQERGVKFRLIKEYVYGTSVQCLSSSGSVQLQLGLRDLFTAFGILMFGFSMSLTLVLVEKLYAIRIRINGDKIIKF